MAALLTGSIWGMNGTTKAPAEAWGLLSYVTGQEGQLLLTELGHARLLPLHPRYPDMETAVNDEVERLLAGAQTPAAAAAAMTARVNALLRG